MTDIFYNRATVEDILAHFVECQTCIGGDLDYYARKIRKNATTIEIWNAGVLIAFCACYMNDIRNKMAYITHIAVLPAYHGMGYGKLLLKHTISLAGKGGFQRMDLEVAKTNVVALNLYRFYHFKIVENRGDKYLMSLQFAG